MVTSRPVAILALTALLASSCDWLSADIFPSWLPYVEGRADIAAAAYEAGIDTLRNLDTVEFVSPTDAGIDNSIILAYLRGLDEEALVAFEPAGMDMTKFWKKAPVAGELLFALGSRIIQTPDGFIAGQLRFNMVDPNADPMPLPGGLAPGSIVLALGSPVVYYYVVQVGYDNVAMTNQLTIQMFNDTPTPTIVTETVRTLALPGTGTYLVDAQYYGNSDLSVGLFRILVRTDTGVHAFSFVSDPALILAADAPEITGPVHYSDSTAWLTADGIVTINHDNETYLARYAYDWTTAEVDPTDVLQLSGDTEDYQIMSFDPSGSWWYLYDRLDGFLYALRTWW